jgi:Caspase domain
LGWEGHALAVGVTGPEQDHEAGEPPRLLGPDPVPDASRDAAQLFKILSRDFQYKKSRKPRGINPAETDDALDTAVRKAIEDARAQQADALVIHLLTHGELEDAGIFVHGGDRPRPTVEVEPWFSAAANTNRDIRPHTLFLLDFCHAGYAVNNLHARAPLEERRVWVIAATRAKEFAFDGRFTRAVIKVLQGYKSGDLTADEGLDYIKFGTFVRDVRKELGSLQEGGFRQKIVSSSLEFGEEEPPDLPFFINPYRGTRGDNLLRAELDPAAQPFIDTVPYEPDKILDYINAAADYSSDSATVHFQSANAQFVGRSAELRKLSDWLDDPGGSPVRVITGKPGVGKSALLGITVCAAHPRLRKNTFLLWSNLDPKPSPQGERFCAAHARGRAIGDIIDGLARQLDFRQGERADRFIQRVARLDGDTPVVVIDAVDEASDAPGLVKALLHPLATKRRRDGSPACRLLIGSRPEPFLDSLIQAGGDDCVIDLGLANPRALHADISKYLNDALQLSGPFAGASEGTTRIRDALVRAAADALTGADNRGGTPDCGEFLVAGLFARQLRDSNPVEDVEAASVLGSKVPRTLAEVLDVDLVQRQSDWLRPLLAAVAHAYGDGMPDMLIRMAMPIMRWGRSDRPGPTTPELREALEAAEFYLRRSVDTDGRTLYRIFHQGLADRLCSEPLSIVQSPSHD